MTLRNRVQDMDRCNGVINKDAADVKLAVQLRKTGVPL